MQKSDNITILIVEDDPDILALWELEFAIEFSHVITAVDGQQAVSILEASKPDLILSDIMLPKLDGFGLCNQLKLSPNTYRIPVILYSAAFIDEKDKQLALGYGAARILQKSISIQELIALTKEVVTETQFSEFIVDIGDSLEQQNLTELHVERMSNKLTDLLGEVNDQREALRSALDRFRDFASCMSDYFWETNAEGKLIFANTGRRSKLTLPHFAYDNVGLDKYFANYFDQTQLSELCAQLASGDEIEMHLGYLSKQQENRIVQVIAKPYFDGRYKLAGYRGVFSDITERHRQSQQLYFDATHDQLTGLLNRRGLERGYSELVSHASASTEHVLCFIDLNDFKVINDDSGHAGGDKLLVAFGQMLLETARKTDLVARLGGDEFALFMPNCDMHASRRLINVLHQQLLDFNVMWEDQRLTTSMSVGCVVTMGCDANLDDLLHEADQACYQAKASGGDHVCVYSGSPTLTQQIDVARNQLTPEKFTAALRNNEFSLYKQPIVHAGEEHLIVSYETLLRLKHDSVVMLPALILPIAESYSMSVVLDRWVVANSLQWFVSDKATRNGTASLSINLSGASICDEKFLNDLVSLITDNKVEPKQLAFEVNGDTLQRSPEQSERFITTIRNLGCRIILDNFGSGLAGLANLVELQVDQLKLSARLIRGLDRNERQLEIIRSLQTLATSLGMDIIAHNVDSKSLSRALTEAGVFLQQGNFFAEPVDVHQAGSNIATRQISA